MRELVITSSILIIAILGIRYLAKGRINPVLQYALWLPVVFRLIFPLPLWNSQLSILNYIPSVQGNEEAARQTVFSQTGAGFEEMLAGDGKIGEYSVGENDIGEDNAGVGNVRDEMWTDTDKTQAYAAPMNEKTADNGRTGGLQSSMSGATGLTKDSVMEKFAYALPVLWIIGTLSIGGYMLFYQIKWKQYLKKNRKLLQNVGSNGIYRSRLTVYTVEGLPSPCLCGQHIYLTKEMAADKCGLAHILAHEYCHYKHLDFVWVIVRCVLCAVYWFHPLVWVAAYVSKQDSELACDAAAIRLLGEKERISYGKTLLRLVVSEGSFDKRKVGIASTMSGGEKGIKERISLIAGKRRYVAVVSVIAVILVAGFIAITFSGKEQGQRNADQEEGLNAENGRGLSDSDEMQDNLQNGEIPQGTSIEDVEIDKMIAEQQAAIAKAEQNTAQEMELMQEVRLEAEDKAREEAVLTLLDSYDKDIAVIGSREGVYGFTNAKNPSDYVQAYNDEGESALDEGMYLLEVSKGPDGSDIKIYGMYTKEYGCEGITILTADDSAKFDLSWAMMYGYGRDENLRLYESAEDGMPRTFAFQMRSEIASDHSEIYDYYLCDRYDTGTIILNQFKAEDYLAQMAERISFKSSPDESCIYVYDKDTLIGSIDVPASSEAMKKIDEVVLDGRIVYWDLGNGEELPRLRTAVGLKIHTDSGEELTWYHGMNPLSFSVECGNFGERNFVLGQAEIEAEYTTKTNLITGEPQTLDEFIEPHLHFALSRNGEYMEPEFE